MNYVTDVQKAYGLPAVGVGFGLVPANTVGTYVVRNATQTDGQT